MSIEKEEGLCYESARAAREEERWETLPPPLTLQKAPAKENWGNRSAGPRLRLLGDVTQRQTHEVYLKAEYIYYRHYKDP